MPINIIMPQLGESITEGTLTKWLVKEGDVVKRDQDIFEVSTDKVDSAIQSEADGTVQKILVKVGAKVPVNTVVAILEDAAGSGGASAPSEPSPEAAPAPAPAPARAPEPARASVAAGVTAVAAAPSNDGGRVFSSPLVRAIARKEGVDLSQVRGTGWKGRITKKDMEEFLAQRGGGAAPAPAPASVAPAPAPVTPAPPLPPQAPAGPGRSRVEPMSPMRAKIAEHMIASRRTSAHVTTVFEVDMTAVAKLRAREKEDFQKVYGAKLTFTPFFAMAAIQAIKDFPIINASVDGNSIVYKQDINLGIAVALPDGLIVPVIRNCEEKSFLGIARAVQDLADRARTKKITLNDIQGGTFTITNPGTFGGLFATPIINQPEVAILGIGTIEKRPVVINDAIAIRQMCYIDLSFDHRVIDGAVADQFMARVKEILQTWNLPLR